MNERRIAFVTEAGPGVGIGHLRRCLSLARAVAADGATPVFVIAGPPAMEAMLSAAADPTRRVPWPDDPREGVEAVAACGADVVVVDSYAATGDFIAALRSLGALVVVIDDLADRALPAHVVVNGGVAAAGLPYHTWPDTRRLLGPRYALLDPVYGDGAPRAAPSRIRRLLISLGGGDVRAVLPVVVAAADRALAGAMLDVVVGPFADDPGALAPPASRNRVAVHRGLSNLRALMLQADAAVSAAGMTLYELAATATPTVTVRLADNQRLNDETFVREGATLSAGAAGADGFGAALVSALARVDADSALRARLAARARELVDGRGAVRVARELAGAGAVHR